MNRNSFSRRLRIALSTSEYKSGNALAADIGCSQQSVHSWLKSAAEPGRDRLVALAIKLNVTINWLAAGEVISSRDAQLQLEIDKEELSNLKKMESKAKRIDELKIIKDRINSMHKYLSMSEESIKLLEKLDKKGGSVVRRIRKHTSYKANINDDIDDDRVAEHLSVDQNLMGRCTEAFGKLYKEMGITLSMADLGSLAGEAYNDVIAATSDPDEQYVVIKALIARRRREILNETNANNQGKLSAS